MKPALPRFANWSDHSCSRTFGPLAERPISELAEDPSGLVRVDYMGQAYVLFGPTHRPGETIEVHGIGKGINSWPMFMDGRWCWLTNPDGSAPWRHQAKTSSQRGNVSRSWVGPLGATIHGYLTSNILALTCRELGFNMREVGTMRPLDPEHADTEGSWHFVDPRCFLDAQAEATRLLKAEATMAVNRLREALRKLR